MNFVNIGQSDSNLLFSRLTTLGTERVFLR